MSEIGHFIDGRRVPGTPGRRSPVFNPATGKETGSVALASKAEMDAIVAIAAQAQPAWGATPPAKRPIDSIFCAWSSWFSRVFRLLISVPMLRIAGCPSQSMALARISMGNTDPSKR